MKYWTDSLRNFLIIPPYHLSWIPMFRLQCWQECIPGHGSSNRDSRRYTYRGHRPGSRRRTQSGGGRWRPAPAKPRCWVDTDHPLQWGRPSCHSRQDSPCTARPAGTSDPRRRQRSHRSHPWRPQKLCWCRPQCWRVLWRLEKEQFIYEPKWFPARLTNLFFQKPKQPARQTGG